MNIFEISFGGYTSDKRFAALAETATEAIENVVKRSGKKEEDIKFIHIAFTAAQVALPDRFLTDAETHEASGDV